MKANIKQDIGRKVVMPEPVATAEMKPVTFNKNQKASIETLFKLMEKHKNDREADMLVKYLTDTNCMNHITKYGEQHERDLVKILKNIDTLIDISTQYETMEEFYNQIALFSGETQLNRDEIKKGIKVMTIHSSKGLEYKHVFLPFWNVGNVPMQGFPNFG